MSEKMGSQSHAFFPRISIPAVPVHEEKGTTSHLCPRDARMDSRRRGNLVLKLKSKSAAVRGGMVKNSIFPRDREWGVALSDFAR